MTLQPTTDKTACLEQSVKSDSQMIQIITDAMVERASAAYVNIPIYQGEWPNDWTQNQQNKVRARMRTALTAALTPAEQVES